MRQQLSWADDQFVTGVKFSSDGRTLVALTEPDTTDPTGQRRPAFLTRWDVTSGRRLTGPIRISSNSGDTLLTTSDGARLIVVTGAETLVLRLSRSPWNFGGGQCLIRRHPPWSV